MPCQGRHITPGNRYTYIFLQIVILFIVTKASGGGAQNIFTFLGMALKKIIEKHFMHSICLNTLAQFSAQEPLIIHKNTFRSEFLIYNLPVCCMTEKF